MAKPCSRPTCIIINKIPFGYQVVTYIEIAILTVCYCYRLARKYALRYSFRHRTPIARQEATDGSFVVFRSVDKAGQFCGVLIFFLPVAYLRRENKER